jgi:hypothetical protein
MTDRLDYYRLLQVQPDASTEVVRSSFRALMRERKLHPDLGGSTAEAQQLIEAYETLTDAVRRADYDRGLSEKYTRKLLPAGPTPTLPPAAVQPMTGGRAFSRMKRGERILFLDSWLQETEEGRMVDFCPGGMMFLCELPLPPRSVVRVSTTLFKAVGNVVHCRENVTDGRRLFATGVAFIDVSFHAPKGSLISIIA